MATKIDGHRCKPLPARTQAAMNKGMPQRKAVATTTSPSARNMVPR
jgi:hypothetical protein